MNGIYQYILHETSIGIEDIKPDKIIIEETLNKRFTITILDNGCTIIKINKCFVPVITQYINLYGDDLFAVDAVSYIKDHFRLNSTKYPCEYIYGITKIDELSAGIILDSTVQIDLQTIKSMEPNKYEKYPFKNPNENLIYFGTYVDGEIVSLVSGYLGVYKAIELTAETLPEHRNKGYAKSNTSAITRYLLENGYDVMTTNGVSNKGSVKTVESLGFKRYGCRLVFFAV